jgi:hypothetical protein
VPATYKDLSEGGSKIIKAVPTTIYNITRLAPVPCDQYGVMVRKIVRRDGEEKGPRLFMRVPMLVSTVAWNMQEASRRADIAVEDFMEDDYTGVWQKSGLLNNPRVRPWSPTAHMGGRRMTFEFEEVDPFDPRFVLELDLTVTTENRHA